MCAKRSLRDTGFDNVAKVALKVLINVVQCLSVSEFISIIVGPKQNILLWHIWSEENKERREKNERGKK